MLYIPENQNIPVWETLVGNQIELCLEYIQLHYPKEQYDVETIIFEDEGFSGGTTQRPQFQEMLQRVKEKSFHVLICYRLDRISRNIADFSNLINELSKHNISFISIKEQFDTRTPMGRAMMYIASVFAQLEREVIAERIRDNLLELSKTGTWLGGDPPLGFSVERFEKVDSCDNKENKNPIKKYRKASKLIINKKELETYHLIISKYEELKSLSKVETYLMNNNIKTRNGKHYSIFAIKAILTNPVYVKNDEDAINYFKEKEIHIFCENDDRKKFNGRYGFLTYNKTTGKKSLPVKDWIYAVGLHPGIIEGKRWIAIQLLLEKNANKRYRAAGYPKKQTIVSGLIKCKQCGSFMRPRNMNRKRQDGTVHYRYCCIMKEKSRGQKCNAKNVIGEELDNYIIQIIKETFVPNLEIYKELEKMSIKKENNIDEKSLRILEEERKNIQKEIKKIIKKLEYVDIDLINIVNDNIRELKKKQEKIEKEISHVKKRNKNKTDIDILKMINLSFEIFDLFDLKTKRDIAKIFIESIYGSDDHIEINFATTTITEFQKKIFNPTFQK